MMKRDICRIFKAELISVYNAYLKAATEKYGRECIQKPFYSIEFGLNYSLQYNLIGGQCKIHFMPYNGGTAVNIRYTLEQLEEAHYDAHEKGLLEVVESQLHVRGSLDKVSIEQFLDYESWVKAQKEQNSDYTVGPNAIPTADRPNIATIVPGEDPIGFRQESMSASSSRTSSYGTSSLGFSSGSSYGTSSSGASSSITPLQSRMDEKADAGQESKLIHITQLPLQASMDSVSMVNELPMAQGGEDLFCKFCGKPRVPGAPYCAYCGKRLRA